MKVLLVKPFTDSHLIAPPIGLGYLATAIRGQHEVKILDCVKERVGDRLFIDFLKETKPDVVGFQVYSYDIPQVEKSLRIVKDFNPKIVTLIGGPHPSCLPDESMIFLENADFGFCGESEIGLPILLEYLESSERILLSDIPGLIWRNNGHIICNEKAMPQDLDKIGFPSWDLIRPQDYPRGAVQGGFVKNFPVAPIITTRGCPYLCTFCAGPLIFGRKVRSRSLDNIISEIELLYNDYNIKEIQIVDDHFIFDTDFTKEFCRRMIEKGLNLTFYAVAGIRIDRIDEELINLMRKAGFYHLAVGIESGSDRILKLMKKGLTVDKVRENVKIIHNAGLETIGFFIVGYPDETKEDILKTIDLACELNLKRAQFSCCQPLPGTEIYNNLKRNGKLKYLDWQKVHFSKISYVPDTLTYPELMNLKRYAFFRFMFRPKIILNHLKEIKSFSQLKFLLKRFLDYII